LNRPPGSCAEPPREIVLHLDSDVRSLLRVGSIRAEPVRVEPASDTLLGETKRLCAELARRHSGQSPADIEGLTPARALYKAFGIDPTRTRPSSEALLRRILRNKPFPRILNAVDVCNYCSASFLLPMGLYDAGRIIGDVTLRRGTKGESYAGIRKDDVHLEGRPVLCDARRPFGNPTSDSAHTAVTPQTVSLWMTVFAPRSYPREILDEHVRSAGDLVQRHLAGARPPSVSCGIVE
jgi:DNA/RNA-binding domain of Phe-tRNA-synthetase-like protein